MFDRQIRIGFMKGGQLGRMLLEPCIKFGVLTHVLDGDPKAPCRAFATQFTEGDALNFDDVYNFGKTVDLLTLEFENVNVEALKKLKAEGLPVHPSPDIIELVQDKGKQKEFFKKAGIESAEFVYVENKEDIKKQTGFVPGIQKLRRSGYDGRGVFKIKSATDIDKALEGPSILEKPVSIAKELSVIVSRNEKGEIKTFPLVEMEFNQEGNILDFLVCPANVPDEIGSQADKIAHLLAEKLGLVGLLAVELFLTPENKILVNEISPRPHNSGHHTIEANLTSQYEQHLRAILGLPLGPTDLRSPAVMINLLGEKGAKGKATYVGFEKILEKPGVYPHLYGKDMTSPLRKMGHVTILGSDINQAKETAQWVKQNVKVTA